MQVLVTGGAGFIGSHLVERLVADGHNVTVLDNLSAGKMEFLSEVSDDITFVQADAGDAKALAEAMKGKEAVWHLAANPEVRTGETDPSSHIRENVTATFAVLESMRAAGVKKFYFTSTSTVYGVASIRPTPEFYGPLLPISIYGASKLAAEAIVASYAGTFGVDAVIFRFANVVGPRSTHGVIYDFVRKLRNDPKILEILGDGTQTKSYVSVEDTVDAMLFAAAKSGGGVSLYNVGSLDAIPVSQLAEIVAAAMRLKPKYRFTGGAGVGGAGWKGDVKNMGLDISTLRKLGWKPKHTSSDAVRIAAKALIG